MAPSIDPDEDLHPIQTLAGKVWGQQAPVIGCVRRNVLEETTAWRFMRGHAILAALGTRVYIEGPWGPFAVWVRYGDSGDAWVLEFRGGWRQHPWWLEDAQLLAALVNTYSNLGIRGVALIEELDSKLSAEYIEAPSGDEATLLVGEALSRWKNQSRLNKSSPRARAVCPHCPVKQACDRMDIERNETADWPNGVPVSAHS